MKKKFFMVAAVVSIGSHAISQQDSSAKVLDDVTITATRFLKKQAETGKVITVITRQQIERSSGKDLSQLLNEQTGIIVNSAGSNPGKDKAIYLRGAKQEYTLILLDGIPVTDPSGAGGAFDLRLLPIDQIERIEILKGSQSTLYGSDAIAGVINIITKKSGNKKTGGNGILSYGSMNSFKANASLNGKTGILDYNAGYTYFDTKGISEAIDTTGTGNFDRDGYTQHAFNISLGIAPVKSFQFTPYLRINKFDGDYDADAFTDGPGKYKADLLNTGATARYKLEKGAVNILYGYSKTNRLYKSGFGDYDFKGRFHNAGIFANYDLHKYLQFLAGLDYQQLKMLVSDPASKDPSVSFTSPYLSLFLRNLCNFNFELGGRYNHHSKYGNNFTFSINPSYLLNKTAKIFFNYSTGFKAPTLSQLYGQFGANPDLKPEKSTSIEAGIQASLADNIVDIRIVAFDRKVKDAIAYGPMFSYINQDRQHDRGFEIEPAFRISENITIRAGYSFVDGKVTTINSGKDTSYFNLARRPKHSVLINIAYSITPDLFISTNFKVYSKRTDIFYNPAIFYAAEDVTLKAYVLWDIYGEYSLCKKRLVLFADAKNITGSRFTEVYGYNTAGFTISGGIRFKIQSLQ